MFSKQDICQPPHLNLCPIQPSLSSSLPSLTRHLEFQKIMVGCKDIGAKQGLKLKEQERVGGGAGGVQRGAGTSS